jgi:hypothetical protein
LYASLCVKDHLEEDLAAVLWACCRLDLKLPPNLLENAAWALAMHAEKGVSKSLAQSLRYLVILTSREMEEENIEKKSLAYIESQLSRALTALSKHTGQISGWDISTLVIAYSTLPNLSLPHDTSLQIQNRLIEPVKSLPSRILPKLAFALVRLNMTEARLVDALYASVEHKAGIIPLDVRFLLIVSLYSRIGARRTLGCFCASIIIIRRCFILSLFSGTGSSCLFICIISKALSACIWSISR